jgi:hypothetical protein
MTISANSFPNHVPSEAIDASTGIPPVPTQGPRPFGNLDSGSTGFVDRRASEEPVVRIERRQFSSSYSELTPDAQELAIAIDRYKVEHRRRYITCEEMLAVVKQLGYHRD